MYTVLGSMLTELEFFVVDDGSSLCSLGCASFVWGAGTNNVATFQPRDLVEGDNRPVLFAATDVSADVPEPATLALFVLGLLAMRLRITA